MNIYRTVISMEVARALAISSLAAAAAAA